jgi:hypothetical protein
MERAALDERLAQALAAVLVAELRAEMAATNNAVHDERPAAGHSGTGAGCGVETRAHDRTQPPLRRAS